MKYFVYILRSLKDGSFYIGQTSNIEERVNAHNNGKSKSTAYGVPWELVYQEEFETRSESMKREKYIKGKKSRTFIVDLILRFGSSAG